MSVVLPIRAASPHCGLALIATHRYTPAPAKKTRLPDDVDVVLASDIVISLSGVLNDSKIAPADILASQLGQHLVDYLRANATELGIAPVSSMYLDDTEGLPTVRVTSSRCLPPETSRVHVVLTGIHLKYIWRTTESSTSDCFIHPFSRQLSLPFRQLLDNVIYRFCTWQLVRRYPLIFGPWSVQLDVERPHFTKLFRSILSVIKHSQNAPFRKTCSRLFKTIQEQHKATHTAASSSLKSYLGASLHSSDDDDDDSPPALTDSEFFSLSMELRYRTCLRRPKFKGSASARTTFQATTHESDDDELSRDQSLFTPESSQQRFDEALLWHNPADAAIPHIDSSTANFDSDFDFDLPPASLNNANIDHWSQSTLNKPDFAIEYQDPEPFDFDFWRDGDEAQADDLLSLLSSDEEMESLTRTVPNSDSGCTLVDAGPDPDWTKGSDKLGFPHKDDDDVIMDLDAPHEGHAERSPDALYASPTRIGLGRSLPADVVQFESQSNPVCQEGTVGTAFSGLSSKQCQAVDEDLELSLCFDSDEEAHDGDLGMEQEGFEDATGLFVWVANSGGLELGHHTGGLNRPESQYGGGAQTRAWTDGMDVDCCLGLFDEDWE